MKAELGLKIRSAVGEQLDLGCGGGLRRRSGCRANGGASGLQRWAGNGASGLWRWAGGGASGLWR